MEKNFFGRLPDGRAVSLYTLDSGSMQVKVLDYGCRIQSIIFDGVDFACGFDTLEAYLADTSSQGAFVGRVANRIKNACFTLNNKTYQLPKNDGNNHLHGCFGQTLWQAEMPDARTLVFKHRSLAEEEGYPGDMELTVTYRLEGTALMLDYQAIADDDTPINLTNHTYFNIGGIGSGTVLDHEMQILSDRVTVVDAELIPTGAHMDVTGSAYDFRTYQQIGARLGHGLDGYDTNFWLTKEEPSTLFDRQLYRAGSVRSASYQMDCYTDMPCMQVYSANFLGNGPDFKNGIKQEPQHAICLETQFEPDSVNRSMGILSAGEHFHRTTVYQFIRR